MKPQFKLVGEEVILNNYDWFWTEIESTHISFKRGIGSSWFGSSGDHKSTNNRRFIEKKGNCYHLPELKFTISGYHYESIIWDWRCRECREPVLSRDLLDSLERCSGCHRGKEKEIAPS